MALRYTFARVISTLNLEAIRALPDALVGSGAVVFGSSATIEDALTGFDAITGSGTIAVGSAADITPSVGDLTGSAAVALTNASDITPSVGVIAGAAAIVVADVADATPSVGTVTGSAAVVFTDTADVTPSVGSVVGSAAMALDDPATTLGDANSGLSNILGSTAITFGSAADVTPSLGVSTGSAAVTFSDAATTLIDANAASTPSKLRGPGYRLAYRFENRLGFQPSVLTQNVARFYGIQLLIGSTIGRLTSAADITPSVGAMTGSAAVVSSHAAVLEDLNAGVSAIVGSASITFGSSVTLDQIGLESSAQITFGGAGDLTPSRGRLRGTTETLVTTSAALTDAGAPPSHGIGTRLAQPFRRWGYSVVAALHPRYAPATSLGALTGSTTITFGEAATLDGVTSLTGSAAIVVGSSTTLDNVGGPGTVQVTGSSSITFADTASLVDISPMTGTTIIRFQNAASNMTGRSRLVSAEPITFINSSTIRANAKVEVTDTITFTTSGSIDNIGVDLLTGSSLILVSDNASMKGRYVSWIPEDGDSGTWGKETPAADGWNKETSVSDTWVKEAS